MVRIVGGETRRHADRRMSEFVCAGIGLRMANAADGSP